MVPIKSLLEWRSDEFTEDHLTNLVRAVFDGDDSWHVAYFNPPSGSWKKLTLVHNNVEYFQEIHKRGESRMKRPDVVAQYLPSETKTRLLLFESKQSKSSWDRELPAMMERFFEGVKGYDESGGIRQTQFWQRRKLGTEIWETMLDEEEERNWFKRAAVEYVYGFGFMRGIKPPSDVKDDVDWMNEQLSLYDDVPPIMVISVGWNPKNYEPYVIPAFSDSFPDDLAEEIRTALPIVNEPV